MNHRDAFLHQLKNPYQSTIAFEQFLNKKGCFREGSEVLDIGTGFGGLLHYFKDKHPCLNFHGIDYDQKNIDGANSFLRQKKPRGFLSIMGIGSISLKNSQTALKELLVFILFVALKKLIKLSKN